MSQGAKSHTIQIDSATAEKVNDEHYKLSLSPSIDVPYLAKPRAQLESLGGRNDSRCQPLPAPLLSRTCCAAAVDSRMAAPTAGSLSTLSVGDRSHAKEAAPH